MQPKDSIVFFPSLGMAHLIPMAELAKLFVAAGFSVTIAIFTPAADNSSSSAAIDLFIARVSASCPSILFHRLPKIVPSPEPKFFHYNFETLRLASAHLLDFLNSVKSTSTVRALVLDMFCVAGFDVGEALDIPTFSFFSNNAVLLAAFLSLPHLQSTMECSFRDLGTKINLPGIPPISYVDLPDDVPDRTETNAELMWHLEQLWRADGFIINTYEWLEERAVEALKNGAIIPGRKTPPVYCIGPLVTERGNGHECFSWLDAQPEKSVVFICFGSASFAKEQLEEMALGLERSGQRFLWSVRGPPDVDLDEFVERTKGRGVVVSTWISQVDVLAHASVGAFMGHCGWNSALEGVAAGVPLIAWPLFAEHRTNKVFFVEEAKVAVAVEKSGNGTVSAEEIGKKIRWLMESEEGKAVSDRAAVAKEKGVDARKEEGSSALAWIELVKVLKKDSEKFC